MNSNTILTFELPELLKQLCIKVQHEQAQFIHAEIPTQHGFATFSNPTKKLEIALLNDQTFLVKFYNNLLSMPELFLFNLEGKLIQHYSSESSHPIFYPVLLQGYPIFEQSAILSYFYALLKQEYFLAQEGKANLQKIQLFQNTLQSIQNVFYKINSVRRTIALEIIKENYNRLLQVECNPLLTFKEKQILRTQIKKERRENLNTIHRAHFNLEIHSSEKQTNESISRVSRTSLHLNCLLLDLKVRALGIRKLPREKIKGVSYKYTLGIVEWFISVVRNNIGYSVALALYAPFTFYFITQPINPHAMRLVGIVRSAYIDTTQAILSVFNFNQKSSPLLSSQQKAEPSPTPIVEESTIPSQGKKALVVKNYQNIAPQWFQFLLPTDVPEVEKQSWSERMSNFKNMQIAYESNLQFSARMGRIEQMETQLNFGLIAESAYREVQRYEKLYSKLPENLKKIIPEEKELLFQMKLYIWDKLIRYALDHPYIVLNEAKDQEFIDAYLGRTFVFLEEVTFDLSRELKGLKKPKGYKKIEKLAEIYLDKKINSNHLMDRLEKNSSLSALAKPYDTIEFRKKVQRQWEILFLLQNRAQEAANFALQTYTWSVRNAIWIIQSLFSAKSAELYALQTQSQLNEIPTQIEPLYESLLHLLEFEYVSIREEILNSLDSDIDSFQRQTIIESLKHSFKQRDQWIKQFTLK